jgi:hypothetical protein
VQDNLVIDVNEVILGSMNKRCNKCGKIKRADDFHFKDKAKGVLRDRCKSCWSKYHRQHYLANKATYISNAIEVKRKLRRENRILLLEYLSTHPCIDCGESDPVVLEFDHVNGDKTNNVAELTRYYGWDKVIKEIMKCVVRCANCHRRRTAKQLSWYQYAEDE